MRVLVTGATGFVGSRLVPQLLAAGHEVTALVRDAAAYDAPEGVRVLEGDLLDPGSVRLLAGPGETPGQPLGRLLSALDVEAAYYLVHSVRAGADAAERDLTAAGTFADAAGAAGIGRVVYLGFLPEAGGEDDLPERLAARRGVEAALADGDPDLTTLRADLLVGDGGAGFELVRRLAARQRLMLAPRWVGTECRPVAVDDAVAALVGVLDAPGTASGTYGLAGPETLTYGEVLRRTGAELGGRPYVLPLPLRLRRLSAPWVALVTGLDGAVVRLLVDGLCAPPVEADDVREHVPAPATPFEGALRRALDGTTAADPAEAPPAVAED